jgi:hypothetical protein
MAGRSKFDESQATMSSNKSSVGWAASECNETERDPVDALRSKAYSQWALEDVANVREEIVAAKRNCLNMTLS